MSYLDKLTEAMTWLGKQSETIFLGQSISFPGNTMYKTLCDVVAEKKIELPVMEDCQLGMSIGLALAGKIPISIFPRLDFMMCCMNQLVNHLDKMDTRVIIRTGVGATKPLYPGRQHCGDYPIEAMLQCVDVIRLSYEYEIIPSYQRAFKANRSTILIEYGDKYSGEK